MEWVCRRADAASSMNGGSSDESGTTMTRYEQRKITRDEGNDKDNLPQDRGRLDKMRVGAEHLRECFLIYAAERSVLQVFSLLIIIHTNDNH